MQPKPEILVLGAGVSGLSTGLLLLEQGRSVTIWAKDLSPDTNSDKAAAFWFPYKCSPQHKIVPWAKATFDRFVDTIVPDPAAGCAYETALLLFDEIQPEPWWQAAIDSPVERPSGSDLPPGFADAYRFQTIVIDTSRYMPYLTERFQALGGTIVRREVTDIQTALEQYPTVVNCTGLGSKALFGDAKLDAVRGQMVRVKPNGFAGVMVHEVDDFALAAARTNDLVLGGTAQEGNWNTEPDPADTKAILAKVRAMYPQLGEIEILEVSVGLRPFRDPVRLEAQAFAEGVVVHNYGHGGAGFTLSWGCAQDAVALVNGAEAGTF